MIELAIVDHPRRRVPSSTVISRVGSELLRTPSCHCAEPSRAGPRHLHQCSTPLSHLPQLEIEVVDWDALFRAVEDRLKRTVVERPARPEGPHDPVGRIQHIVLDCVEALDLLHAALTQERARAQVLEAEVSQMRAGLQS